MDNGWYYKVGKNKYIEVLDDNDARSKYGENARVLITKRKDNTELHEILKPIRFTGDL